MSDYYTIEFRMILGVYMYDDDIIICRELFIMRPPLYIIL